MLRTNLGGYLYSERIRRKQENISAYISDYHLNISESYYRDLETGRKIARIETAKELCQALELDTTEFFFHLLKDVLPESVFETLIKPSQKAIFTSASDEIERLTRQLNTVRKAYKRQLAEDPFEVDEKIVAYLNGNFEILPVIHFIYMRQRCSFEEVEQVVADNGIALSASHILDELKRLELAVVDEDRRVVTRHKRLFRIPKTERGKSFKDRFFKHEANLSSNDTRRGNLDVVNPESTYLYSVITSISMNGGAAAISDQIADFTAAVDAAEVDLENADAMPFFVSLVISPRPMYDVKQVNRTNPNTEEVL